MIWNWQRAWNNKDPHPGGYFIIFALLYLIAILYCLMEIFISFLVFRSEKNNLTL